MVKIVIENRGQKELVSPDTTKTALNHFHEHQLDWMHACGGKGRCTTCTMIVVQGMDQLGALTQAEQKYRQSGALLADERLSCQAVVKGQVVVRVPHHYKLPHVSYSDSPTEH